MYPPANIYADENLTITSHDLKWGDNTIPLEDIIRVQIVRHWNLNGMMGFSASICLFGLALVLTIRNQAIAFDTAAVLLGAISFLTIALIVGLVKHSMVVQATNGRSLRIDGKKTYVTGIKEILRNAQISVINP